MLKSRLSILLNDILNVLTFYKLIYYNKIIVENKCYEKGGLFNEVFTLLDFYSFDSILVSGSISFESWYGTSDI